MPTGAEAQVSCPYCGSTVIVPEELRVGLPQQEEPSPQVGQMEEITQHVLEAEQAQIEANMAAQERNRKSARSCSGRAITISLVVVVIVCLAGVIPLVVSGTAGVWLGRLIASSSGATLPAASTATEPMVASTATPAPTATSAPTATQAPINTPVPFTKVLFRDNFMNPASGWNVSNASDYLEEYENGKYRVLIKSNNSGQLVWLTTTYTDVSVQVDAQQTAGPDDGWMGVTCRASNDGSMYGFQVSENGSYGIYKYTSGSSSELVGGTLDPNTVNQKGVNTIEGVCSGSTLTLLLNGQALAQTVDSSYVSGAIGLTVNTGDSGQSGVDILFSNYVAMGP
jgi:hypothetical protein